MKVTVCELPNEPDKLEEAFSQLCKHTKANRSEIVLLPEMPFYPWLANTQNVSRTLWKKAVQVHEQWIERLNQLGSSFVVSTCPSVNGGIPQNTGYVWNFQTGKSDIHTKYYLPNEPGYWEATWYQRGEKEFKSLKTDLGSLGFLICTELWFTKHAREYGKQGMQLLMCPRATPASSANKWVTGGQAAAIVSGCFCLSSNLAGKTKDGCDFAGVGWIIEPEEGKVLGLTSPEDPFLTLDIDLSIADKAKKTYPRYVLD